MFHFNFSVKLHLEVWVNTHCIQAKRALVISNKTHESKGKFMKSEKFLPGDRQLVIKELEKIQKSKLFPFKASQKLFIDEKEMLYLIFGGSGDWHGISQKVIDELVNYSREGALVIAKKYYSRIDVCVGSLSQFITNIDRLTPTKKGDKQFHTTVTEDGMFVEEAPSVYLNIVSELKISSPKKDLHRLDKISRIINIEVDSKKSFTHADLQAKLILIGSYLGYRTYTPDQSKRSVYGVLGELCSESQIPENAIPSMHLDSAKYIDVIWFDDEGFPTHGFEVEHTTDITKGMLRLFQVHKLRIKMFIVAEENNRSKFLREVRKNPFHKIQEEYIFKNYEELDLFFESVKSFTAVQSKFFSK